MNTNKENTFMFMNYKPHVSVKINYTFNEAAAGMFKNT